MSRITVHAYRLTTTGAVSATGVAASAIEPQFTDLLNQPGAGSVTFRNMDPIMSALRLDGRDLLQFRIDDVPAWVMIPDPTKVVFISQDEHDGERSTVSGPGLLAIHDRWRVYPAGGVGRKPKPSERLFGWTDLLYDDSGWDAATSPESFNVGDAKLYWPIPWDVDFPDNQADILWPNNPGGNPSTASNADGGVCWFRQAFTAPAEGNYEGYLASDDVADLYIDGEPVAHSEAFTQSTKFNVVLSAGPHVIAVRGENNPNGFIPGAAPGGVAWALYHLTGAYYPPLVVRSSISDVKVLPYQDEPPGAAAPDVFLRLLDEAQFRGVMTDVSASFTATDDTDSNAWDTDAEAPARIGASGLELLSDLSIYMDVAADPDLSAGVVTHAWRPGEKGSASGITFARGVNIASGEASRENEPVTTLLVETTDEWLERVDAVAGAAHGRVESTLTLGAQQSRAEAYRVADAQLDIFATQREEITLGVRPRAGEVPFVDFVVGDTVTCPDSTGVAHEERVVGITVTQDDKSRQAIFTLTLRDIVLSEQERIIVSLRNGT